MSFRPANATDQDPNTSRPETADSSRSSPHSSISSPGIKRKEESSQPSAKAVKKVRKNAPKSSADREKTEELTLDVKNASPAKPKRVRTGCLTCRERHLKCDEGLPDCANCVKSSRFCKRGVKLNFIDIWLAEPNEGALPEGTPLQFHDESRAIAAEYQGGNERYRPLNPDRALGSRLQQGDHMSLAGDLATGASRRHSAALPLPSSRGGSVWSARDSNHTLVAHRPTPPLHHSNSDPRSILSSDSYRRQSTSQSSQQSHSTASGVSSNPHGSASIGGLSNATTSSEVEAQHPIRTAAPRAQSVASVNANRAPSPPRVNTHYNSGTETLYLRAFMDSVTVWLDALDPYNQCFKSFIPRNSLECPMMREAMLACGARHLSLINPAEHHESNVLHHYDQAARQLLVDLSRSDNNYASSDAGGGLPQEPRTNGVRNTPQQAITSVLLNVYDVMSAHSARADVTNSRGPASTVAGTASPQVHPGHQRGDHVAGARILIEKLGWDARTPGIGGACFWNNIGLEVLSCLHYNLPLTRKPEIWGIAESRSASHREQEVWPYTTQSTAAQITNGNANIPFLDWSKDERDNQESLWARRQLFLLAKLCEYRNQYLHNAQALRNPPPHSGPEWSRMASNLSNRWQKLWDLNELWLENRPSQMMQLTMVRVENLRPAPNTPRSNFPEITFGGRTAVVAALFYYTTKLVLARHNPNVILQHDSEGERLFHAMEAQENHAAMTICSITAHTRDPGVASIAIQSLHLASESLSEPAQHTEVLAIFDRISRTIGWRIDSILTELMVRWNRVPSQPSVPMPTTSTPLIPVTTALAGLSMTLPPLQQRDANSPPSLGGSTPSFYKVSK